MKKKVALLILTVGICLGLGGCADFDRSIKSAKSDLGGGLYRTVTLYDYNGKVIKTWKGKFDVSDSESEVYFDDQNGKRVIIHGGIVVNEEN